MNTLFMFTAIAGTRETKMLTIDNSTFENISVFGEQYVKSVFGTRPNAPDDVMDIVIKNLTIEGKKIKKISDFANVVNEGKNLKVIIKP